MLAGVAGALTFPNRIKSIQDWPPHCGENMLAVPIMNRPFCNLNLYIYTLLYIP